MTCLSTDKLKVMNINMKENLLIYYAIIPLSVVSFLIGVFNLFSVPAIPEYVIWLTVPLFIALFYFAYVLNNRFKLSVKLKKNFYMRRVLVCIAIGFFVLVKEKKGGLIQACPHRGNIKNRFRA